MFDIQGFRDRLANQGVCANHYRAHKCVCNAIKTNSRLPNCRNCLGSGIFYEVPSEIQVLTFDHERGFTYSDQKEEIIGRIEIQVSYGENIALEDLFRFPQIEAVKSESIVLERAGDIFYFFTSQTINGILSLSQFIDVNTVYESLDLDLLVIDGRRVELPAALIRETNQSLSIRYIYNPFYRVDVFKRDAREVQMGGETDHLPMHLSLERLEIDNIFTRLNSSGEKIETLFSNFSV